MIKIEEFTNKVFMLSPEVKQSLLEAYPMMDENTKQEFLAYIKEIIAKQEEILAQILKNNPDFLSELKTFNALVVRRNIKAIEDEFNQQEEIDLLTLEQELSKL